MVDSKEEILIEQATFGAGCFWCVEAVFEQLDGVVDVRAGYTAGETKDPTYEQICTGKTGHAEVIQIDYNPNIITFNELVDVFWLSHDPTTLNRQGADRGTQYRSGIYFHNKIQKEIAEKSKEALGKSGLYGDPIVTEIEKLGVFYIAENYHQDYYRVNPNAPYCQMVIRPKLEKLFNKK
jgi:peptide-methionine (S)-S-oxide reductase